VFREDFTAVIGIGTKGTHAVHNARNRYHEGMLGLLEHAKRVFTDEETDEFSRVLRKMGDNF